MQILDSSVQALVNSAIHVVDLPSEVFTKKINQVIHQPSSLHHI